LLFRWPIRVKVAIALGLLSLVVLILAGSGLYTTYAYRSLVKTLSSRVTELPVAARLGQCVGQLRTTLSEMRGIREYAFPQADGDKIPIRVRMLRDQFRGTLEEVEQTLALYREQLERKLQSGSRITDNQREWETVHKFEKAMVEVYESNRDEDWMFDEVKVGLLDSQLDYLEYLAAELPSHLHHRLGGFAAEVRSQYRTLIVGTWITGILAALILALYVKLFFHWIFTPLEVLVAGSRMVAGGMFSYRIHLDTDDEMSELADAMNEMTTRFQDIRDDLDDQVRERTKQAVRSEKMASVGLLASGVAHEINNPLASIAMCAESLESRVRGCIGEADPQYDVIANYLEMIQNEAFRCKGITEKLLDFSRTGETQRQIVELEELIRSVIEMVSHLGKYQEKRIEFEPSEPVVVSGNAQEIKQVILNLLTNALESIGKQGSVKINIAARDGFAHITFDDDGCGIDSESLERVFEPFFTQRESGQGTGLGLSITYRIVADHGGDIRAYSQGMGRGATFRVRLPLGEDNEENSHRPQAA